MLSINILFVLFQFHSMSSLSVSDARAIVSSYEQSYRNLIQELVSAQVSWRNADALLDTLIATGASSSEIQSQNLTISGIETTISQTQAELLALKASYDEAQSVLNASLSIPDPSTIVTSPFVGVTGPTGPQGETGGSTGPTGPAGYSMNASNSASLGSLSISTSLYAPLASFSSATFTDLTASTANVGVLSATSISVPSFTVSDFYTTTLDAGVATATSLSCNKLTISGDCVADGVVSASSINVSGLCTASGGFDGTLLTSNQSLITGLGTLSFLTVSGKMEASSVNVSGLTTSSQGFVGTLLTGVQTGITSIGTQTSLTVSGTMSLTGQLTQSTTGSNAYVATSSVGTSAISLFTNSGSTGYEIGVRTGTSGGTFYINHLKNSGTSVNVNRLTINSSGYVGVATSNAGATLDVGGCTSTMLGTLTNVAGFFGSSSGTSGVLVGAGTSLSNPFLAASLTTAGTSVGLDFYTGDTVRMSIGSSGSVSISSSLSVGGTDFTSAIGGLGYNQYWTSVTSSRALSTIYQNSSSRPLLANVTLSVSGSASTNIFYFNVGTSSSVLSTIAIGGSQIATSTVTVGYCTLSAIVQPSYYYQVTRPSGSSSVVITNWAELL